MPDIDTRFGIAASVTVIGDLDIFKALTFTVLSIEERVTEPKAL